MPGFVTHLESAIDGTHLPADRLQTLHANRPLWVRYDLSAVKQGFSKESLRDRPQTMWRYRELLPIDGSVAAGASQDVQVSADASALDDGEYTAWVCVSTSDPVQAFVPVAVTLTVSGTNPDVIFEDGFDAP